MYRTVLCDRSPRLFPSQPHFVSEGTAEKQVNMPRRVVANSTAGVELKLSILVAGRPGTGKATLMSGLFGREVNKRAVEELGVPSITTSTITVDGTSVRIMFWNSPGIYDNALSEEDKVRKLGDLLDSIDVVIYSMRMDDTRMRPEDIEIMRKLTQTFGASLWSKGVVVLTFANRVNYLDKHQTMRRSKEHSTKRARQWEEHIREVLVKEGLSDGILRSIPYVPAGHSVEPQLFPGEEPWRTILMDAISGRVSVDVRATVLNHLALLTNS